jgi:protein-cysteine N-palmitoyltransferase HHAT
MGQFFHLKYICAYGLGIALGKYDGFRMPSRPICIGIVHLYSDMWKYFDEGLYEFLFKYIYAHLCAKSSGTRRKLFASFITFFFIYLWHGQWMFILIWAVANFVCIVLEYTVKRLYSSSSYKRWVTNHCSRATDRRLRAVIGSHVLIPSVLSNFFFFGETEIGMMFIRRTYFSSWGGYFGLYCICYCFYNIGDWFKRRRGDNKSATKTE